mgnify:CR=1 FL=1
MRKNHHGKKDRLVKRVFALCLALAVICTCLVPVFATEYKEVVDFGGDEAAYPDDEVAGFGGDEAAGFGEPREVYDDSETTSSSESSSGNYTVEEKDDALVYVLNPDSSSSTGTDPVTQWSGEDDVVEKPDDKVVVSGDEIKKLQDMVVYRFWLRELNTLDLQDIATQAQINNMTESEYLARQGEVLWSLYFIQAVPRAETIADYSSYIQTPSSNRDPKGELRLFDYWYTLDEFGNRVRLNLTDPTSNILDDKTTTVNVYAAWKDGTVGSDEEKPVDHEDLVDKNPVPVDLTAKASTSYEDEDGELKTTTLPVEVKNLPSAAHSLSVIHMGDDDMQTFYESHEDSFGEMMPILGLKISPKNAKGEKVQPAKGEKATVTVSGLDKLPEMEGATADTLKVFHETSDGNVEILDVLTYTNGTLTFETSSFSPFVVVRTNGYDVETLAKNPSEVAVNDTVTLQGSGRFKNNHKWTVKSGSKGEVTISPDGHEASVTGKKTGTVTIVHTYGKNGREEFTLSVVNKVMKDRKSVTFTPNIQHAQVAYIHYTKSESESGTFVQNAELTEVSGTFTLDWDHAEDNYWVFFVKPDENYLITGLGASGYGDIYSLASSNGVEISSLGNIDSYPKLRETNCTIVDSLAKKAKDLGYIGVFGYSRTKKDSNGFAAAKFEVIGQSPDITVTAESSKTVDVVEGDELTFTIRIKPGEVAGTVAGTVAGSHTSKEVSVSNINVNKLTINGREYTCSAPQKGSDGTWVTTVSYKATAEDCQKGYVELNVEASVDYTVQLAVSQSPKVTTNATIEKSASTTCYIAPKNSVRYAWSLDASDSVKTNCPDELKNVVILRDGKDINNQILYKGTVHIVDTTYTNGKTIEDNINGGIWSFSGWYTDEELKNPAPLSEAMTEEGLNYYGKWTFTKTVSDLTVTKHVSGLLGDFEKEFKFTLYVKDDATIDNATYTKEFGDGIPLANLLSAETNREGYKGYRFILKNGQSIKFTRLPVGTYYVQEDSYDNYTVSAKINGADTTVTDRAVTAELTKEAMTIAFTNCCDLKPDTGVLLDTLPYIVILAVVVGGVALLMLRKRRKEDD